MSQKAGFLSGDVTDLFDSAQSKHSLRFIEREKYFFANPFDIEGLLSSPILHGMTKVAGRIEVDICYDVSHVQDQQAFLRSE